MGELEWKTPSLKPSSTTGRSPETPALAHPSVGREHSFSHRPARPRRQEVAKGFVSPRPLDRRWLTALMVMTMRMRLMLQMPRARQALELEETRLELCSAFHDRGS